MLHLIGELFEQGAFHLGVEPHRLFERRPSQADHVDGDRALRELGHELRPEVRGDHPKRNEQHGGRKPDNRQLVVHRQVQDRGVEPLENPDKKRFTVVQLLGQNQAREHRHQGHRQQHRTSKGEDHRQRHRAEHLPLDAFEREDRQVDDHDDQLAEHRRLADFDRGVTHDLQPRPARGVTCRKVADAVLHHDDRAIDNQPEVDGPQAEQARGDAEPPHSREGEKHRERDGEGDNQPRPQVAQERQREPR